MTDSISGRTRTPPDLKWLLNERAAVAGAIEKATARCNHFTGRLARLQELMESVNRRAQLAFRVKSRHQRTLEALDATIGLAYSQVRADAAGVVDAWAGRYGERGALKKFVGQVLQEAFPATVDMQRLMGHTACQFEILIVTPADRRSLNYSVKSSLSALRKAGIAEQTHKPSGGSGPGIWRWKPPTSFADIAAKAQRLANAKAQARNASPTDSNPS